MSIPVVSIVMAVYNGEKYIRLAIESVLGQDFKDFEFIVVDDCSTDSTPEIISSYKDERIICKRNKTNIGQTASLNVGLKSSRGEYIARIDADDMYLPGKLKKQHAFMIDHPEIEVCGTFGLKIDEYGNEIGRVKSPTTPGDILFSIFHRTPLIHVSVMMKKNVILKYGGYEGKYRYCADLSLWSKLLMDGCSIANMPEVLMKYRECSDTLGAVHKLGRSGEEAAEIYHLNTLKLPHVNISQKECLGIVLLLHPSSGLALTDICNAYLHLIEIARVVYNQHIPMKVSMKLAGMLIWSMAKRSMYLKSKNDHGFIMKDLFGVYKMFYCHPHIITYSTISYSILILGEKNLYKLKKLYSNFLLR